MKEWRAEAGVKLFKYRSILPLPLIIIIVLTLKPANLFSCNIILSLGGLGISLFGQIIRICAVGFSHAGTSGRESYFKAETLNTSGIYSLVRNPLYWGNLLIFAGLFTAYANGWALLLVLGFLLSEYTLIISAEEHFLAEQYGDAFRAYCLKVRRWQPSWKHWEKPDLPFNLKKVVFKESDSLFNLLVGYLLVLNLKEKNFGGHWHISCWEILLTLLLVAAYLGIKIIKKRSATPPLSAG